MRVVIRESRLRAERRSEGGCDDEGVVRERWRRIRRCVLKIVTILHEVEDGQTIASSTGAEDGTSERGDDVVSSGRSRLPLPRMAWPSRPRKNLDDALTPKEHIRHCRTLRESEARCHLCEPVDASREKGGKRVSSTLALLQIDRIPPGMDTNANFQASSFCFL